MTIDCAQFEGLVHELERSGTPGFAMRREALAHAESCDRCGVLLDKVMALGFALDSLAVEESSDQAPMRVEAALLAEFRRQHAEAVRPERNMRLTAALAMAAALVLVLVGITAPRWVSHPARIAGGSVATTQPSQESPSSTEGAEVADNSALSESEYTTNFVSLPYADDPGTLEGGTVVRVTLSRAALASFGVPVAGMNATDEIPADIALSEDGVPQAIRLVADADLDQSNQFLGTKKDLGRNSQ
jgi:hypothetical protein